MVERINAIIIVEEEEKYLPFAEAINQRITSLSHSTFTKARCRAKKNKEEGDNTTPETEN